MQITLDRNELLIIIGITFFVGGFVGYKIHRPNCPKPEVLNVQTNTVQTTALAYVPKQVDKVSGKTEKTDIESTTGKTALLVKVNGKEVEFKKADNEAYVLEKNKVTLTQTSAAEISIKTETIDLTRKWAIIGGAYYDTLQKAIKPDGGVQFPLYGALGGQAIVGSNQVMLNALIRF